MKDLHQTVELALGALGSLGAQLYSARASASKTNEFNVDGGKFSLFRTTLDASLTLSGDVALLFKTVRVVLRGTGC